MDRATLARAQRRVAALKGFYVHLFAFVSVIAALLLLNIATGDDWWVQWVVLGWGLGVVAHATAIFWQTPSFIAQWEKRKLRQFAGR